MERGYNKICPDIVKFRFQDDKWDVMKARRALTDSRISFAEDMCRELQDLQKVVANHAGVQACWSWKRKIVAKDLSGKIKSVPYGNNWQSLFLIHAPSDQEPMAEEVPEGDCVHCLRWIEPN